MTYDFTTVLDRAGHDCLAADRIPFDGVQPDEGFDVIPMWIADMAFPTAPPVLDAIKQRMEMPNFGYFALPKEYYQASSTGTKPATAQRDWNRSTSAMKTACSAA